MSAMSLWHLRWLRSAREWLNEHQQQLSAERRRTLRFAFDRRLQVIAQFPYTSAKASMRYDSCADAPETYRVANVDGLLLFYLIDVPKHTLVVVRVQPSTMNVPSLATILSQQ